MSEGPLANTSEQRPCATRAHKWSAGILGALLVGLFLVPVALYVLALFPSPEAACRQSQGRWEKAEAVCNCRYAARKTDLEGFCRTTTAALAAWADAIVHVRCRAVSALPRQPYEAWRLEVEVLATVAGPDQPTASSYAYVERWTDELTICRNGLPDEGVILIEPTKVEGYAEIGYGASFAVEVDPATGRKIVVTRPHLLAIHSAGDRGLGYPGKEILYLEDFLHSLKRNWRTGPRPPGPMDRPDS